MGNPTWKLTIPLPVFLGDEHLVCTRLLPSDSTGDPQDAPWCMEIRYPGNYKDSSLGVLSELPYTKCTGPYLFMEIKNTLSTFPFSFLVFFSLEKYPRRLFNNTVTLFKSLSDSSNHLHRKTATMTLYSNPGFLSSIMYYGADVSFLPAIFVLRKKQSTIEKPVERWNYFPST